MIDITVELPIESYYLRHVTLPLGILAQLIIDVYGNGYKHSSSVEAW